MTSTSIDPRLRQKYRHFRILVIGRANAGKTTLLKRVCNTTEEPCIYDEDGKNLLEPSAGRGIHDVRRPFGFACNPEFIFHDSPGFENGDERQLKEVQSFIAERARATEVADQLHAIWFCFIPNAARPLLDLEIKFFNEARTGNGLDTPFCSSVILTPLFLTVPVVAIYTKFDDLITQVYNEELDEQRNRDVAESVLEKKFQKPLDGFTFPPRAHVRMEDLHDDDSDHQGQVKGLLTKTADSLDDIALKILFVSVQQNNLELCLTYAVKYLNPRANMDDGVMHCLQWFRHVYWENYEYGKMEKDDFLEYSYRPLPSYFPLPEFFNNCFSIGDIFQTIMPWEPSLIVFSALLLCTENSFWYKSHCSSFLGAFKQAIESYMEIGVEKNGENAVKLLGDWPVTEHEQEIYRSALTNILLEHRLPHPE